MASLPKAFLGPEHYASTAGTGPYSLLPSRFLRLADGRYFISNEVGQFVVLDRDGLESYVRGTLPKGSPTYLTLKSKHFLYDETSSVATDLLSLKYRTRKLAVSRFTSLHLFVVTLRCDYSCPYCQVSRQTDDRMQFDMSQAAADKALELTFKSPSPQIKIEFQGGEPLLNFPLVEYITTKAKALNARHRKDLAFVIATNLSHLSDEVLSFCKQHDVYLSTSLDGPASLHDRNRPRPGKNGHALTVAAIRRAQKELGPSKISALMTTTAASLSHVTEIIDEYVRLDFHGIFLRPLSPFGFAVTTRSFHAYEIERWLEFYRQGLQYIFALNRSGHPFTEYYSAMLLQRLLTDRPASYVDLQSPAGIGIGAVVYNYDGDVYASDEGRMLAEMGKKQFRLGNVMTDSYQDIFSSDNLMDPLEQSLAESSPMCEDCAFLPYCGSDPVFHLATQSDFVGHKSLSPFCARSMGMLSHLVEILESDGWEAAILRSWVQ